MQSFHKPLLFMPKAQDAKKLDIKRKSALMDFSPSCFVSIYSNSTSFFNAHKKKYQE
jgi:hypothetical protein